MFDLVDFIVKLFSQVCHQIPDRSFSFFVFGGKSILCARCTGMYLGMLLSFILAVSARKINITLIIKMLFISVTILIMELIVEVIVVLPFGNVARFTTGMILGGSVGIGIVTPIKIFFGGFK